MTEGLRSIRPLAQASLRGVEPAVIKADLPVFEWVDPKTIFVEENYQRDVAERGISLVRKIYSEFSWARFKPPICVRLPEVDDVLVCIDGQHTAIAAATHPDVGEIPVMVIVAPETALRAAAFVGHNRDRIQLTPQMIYRGEVAQGDETAMAVDRACKAAGAHVLPKAVNLKNKQPVGATVAIGTMKVVVKRYGEGALVRALRILVKAERGPIKADEISAVAMIYARGTASEDDLARLIGSKSAEAWAALGAARIIGTRKKLSDGLVAIWSGARLPSAIASFAPKPAAQVKPIPEKLRPAQVRRDLEAEHRAAAPPPPKPRPLPPPPPPPAAPAPPPPPAVTFSGVTIDEQVGVVIHAGGKAWLGQDGIKLVLALARVMPALLDPSRLASKVLGSAAAIERLRELVASTNQSLVPARLEIKTVKLMGFSLFPLT